MKNVKRTRITGLLIKIEDDGLPLGKFRVGSMDKLENIFNELKKKYR